MENGERILAEPALALQALTHTQATFSRRDLARYLHTRTDGAQQFEAALLKVMASPELLVKALIGVAGSGKSRLLAAASEAWAEEGYTVQGAALSGIAAENARHAPARARLGRPVSERSARLADDFELALERGAQHRIGEVALARLAGCEAYELARGLAKVERYF